MHVKVPGKTVLVVPHTSPRKMPRFLPLASLPAELAPFLRRLSPALPPAARPTPTDTLLARTDLPANLRVQPWTESRARWAGVGRRALLGGNKGKEDRAMRKRGGLKWALRER
ncbi:hypothetical protein Q5752_002433 [Cryptotrichosporon argae]